MEKLKIGPSGNICPQILVLQRENKEGQVEIKNKMHFYGLFHFYLFKRNIKHNHFLLSVFLFT